MSHPMRGNTDTRADSRGPALSGKWPRGMNLLLYRHKKPQRTVWSTDTREDSRHPVLSGKWRRERRIYSGIGTENCNELSGVPIQEKIHATQPYLESGGAKGESALVSAQQLATTPARTNDADTRGDSRRPVLSGKWQRRKVNLL